MNINHYYSPITCVALIPGGPIMPRGGPIIQGGRSLGKPNITGGLGGILILLDILLTVLIDGGIGGKT